MKSSVTKTAEHDSTGQRLVGAAGSGKVRSAEDAVRMGHDMQIGGAKLHKPKHRPRHLPAKAW